MEIRNVIRGKFPGLMIRPEMIPEMYDKELEDLIEITEDPNERAWLLYELETVRYTVQNDLLTSEELLNQALGIADDPNLLGRIYRQQINLVAMRFIDEVYKLAKSHEDLTGGRMVEMANKASQAFWETDDAEIAINEQVITAVVGSHNVARFVAISMAIDPYDTDGGLRQQLVETKEMLCELLPKGDEDIPPVLSKRVKQRVKELIDVYSALLALAEALAKTNNVDP